MKPSNLERSYGSAISLDSVYSVAPIHKSPLSQQYRQGELSEGYRKTDSLEDRTPLVLDGHLALDVQYLSS